MEGTAASAPYFSPSLRIQDRRPGSDTVTAQAWVPLPGECKSLAGDTKGGKSEARVGTATGQHASPPSASGILGPGGSWLITGTSSRATRQPRCLRSRWRVGRARVSAGEGPGRHEELRPMNSSFCEGPRKTRNRACPPSERPAMPPAFLETGVDHFCSAQARVALGRCFQERVMAFLVRQTFLIAKRDTQGPEVSNAQGQRQRPTPSRPGCRVNNRSLRFLETCK